MFTGLFQVFFCIYFPVWADVYGNDEQKSKWLTYLLIASPLGVVMGYGMVSVFAENSDPTSENYYGNNDIKGW